jgi:hypothetical protein
MVDLALYGLFAPHPGYYRTGRSHASHSSRNTFTCSELFPLGVTACLPPGGDSPSTLFTSVSF